MDAVFRSHVFADLFLFDAVWAQSLTRQPINMRIVHDQEPRVRDSSVRASSAFCASSKADENCITRIAFVCCTGLFPVCVGCRDYQFRFLPKKGLPRSQSTVQSSSPCSRPPSMSRDTERAMSR